MKLKSIKQVIKNGYCLGCGLCCVVSKDAMVKEVNGTLKSTYINEKGSKGHVEICPAIGYDIFNLGKEFHNSSKYIYELGWYENIRLARTKDGELLKKASSGGMMSAIALFMLNEGLADGVICTKYTYSGGIPRPVSFIARTKDDLINAQGSKYCPTNPLSLLSQLKSDEKYVLIGTPCQIAGVRRYFKANPDIKNNIILTIANFCGGYRNYSEIDFFVKKIAGFSSVVYFQHRGDGVPGQMKIINEKGSCWQYPYPDYARLSNFQKNKRCVYCIDATGELADISCGDAWLERIKKSKEIWSTIITRNSYAESILSRMIQLCIIDTDVISESEVIKSQQLNIVSKKYRQYKRIRIQNIVLGYVPNWYDCLQNIGGTYYNEIRILLSKYYHRLKRMF